MTSNDFGKNYLVEQCKKITVKDLTSHLKKEWEKLLLESILEINGICFTLEKGNTGNGGFRYWLICPLSGKRTSVLYQVPTTNAIGSRKALGLRYKKCIKKGMVEMIMK